jgi:predicted DNA-binding transcriptional regulator AlpA
MSAEVVVAFRRPVALKGEVVADPDRLLSGPEVARLLGVQASSWRARVAEGRAPAPDDPGPLDVPANRRRPRWRLSTVREFKQSRPGQGFRSDLAK